MTKHVLTVAFAGAIALTGQSAFAETILFDPGVSGIDEITDAGRDNYLEFDLNQDGTNDLLAGIREFGFGGAFIEGLSQRTSDLEFSQPDLPPPPVPLPSDGRGDPIVPIDAPLDFDGPGFGPATAEYQRVTFSSNLFAAGDAINADTFGTPDNLIFLYGRRSTSAENILPNVGDSGIFGFRIETGTANFSQIDGIFFDGFVGDVTTTFGFINIAHGSIQIGAAGYNTDPTSSIIVPGDTTMAPVPLPASSLLLLAGLGGLGALRRKQKA